jgi:Surfeit locus protein 2 (SURF2)
MPLRVDAVQTYITNNRYKRLCDLQQSTEYEKYKEHLVPSNKEDHKYAFTLQFFKFSFFQLWINCNHMFIGYSIKSLFYFTIYAARSHDLPLAVRLL